VSIIQFIVSAPVPTLAGEEGRWLVEGRIPRAAGRACWALAALALGCATLDAPRPSPRAPDLEAGAALASITTLGCVRRLQRMKDEIGDAELERLVELAARMESEFEHAA